MKRLRTLILILTPVLIFACSIGMDSPETTVRNYLVAEATNSLEGMQRLVEPGTSPDHRWLPAAVGEHVLRVDLKKVKLRTTITGDTARVHVSGTIQYTFDNPVDWEVLPSEITLPILVDRSFNLIRVDGRWCIRPNSGQNASN